MEVESSAVRTPFCRGASPPSLQVSTKPGQLQSALPRLALFSVQLLSGGRLAPLGLVSEGRRAVGVTPGVGLVASARGQAKADHGPLVVRHSAEHLADKSARGVGPVVSQVGVLAGLRRRHRGPEAPALGKELLLEYEIAGQAIEPMDHQPPGLPLPQ